MKAPFSRTLFDLLREQSERFADSYAVISGGFHVSYRDLYRRARRVGAALQARGIVRGNRVGVLVSNRIANALPATLTYGGALMLQEKFGASTRK